MAESESLLAIFLYLCILHSCAYCNENRPRRNILHVANSGNHYSDGSGPRVFELDKDSVGYVNLENDKFYGKMKRSVNIQHNITTKVSKWAVFITPLKTDLRLRANKNDEAR